MTWLLKIKNVAYFTAVSLLLPLVSFAQFSGGDNGLTAFGGRILVFINNTLVPFVFSVALLLFIYGVYLYFIQGAHEDEKRKTGRSYIIWSVIALVIMVSVWGITNLIAGGLGLDDDTAVDRNLIPEAIIPR